MGKRQLIETICLMIALAVFIGYGFGKSQSLKNFHIDEVHKISETYYYNLFFIKHDFNHPDWHEDFFARTNPPVAKYIMGAYLSWHGQVVPSLALQQKFEQHWKNPQYLLSQLSASMLMNARALIVIFSGLTLLAIYLIGRMSGSIPLGVLSALLLFCNPMFQFYSTLALTDIIIMFFMTAMVPVTFFALKIFWAEPAKTAGFANAVKFTAMLIICAIVIAAATGTKLNGALTAILFTAAMICGWLISSFGHQNGKFMINTGKLILIISGVMLPAAVIFIALNPYLYDSFSEKMISVLKVYDDLMLIMAIDPGHPLWTGLQKITAIGFFNFTIPQDFFFKTGIPFLLSIFIIGMVHVVVSGVRALSDRRFPEWNVTVILWVIVYGIGIGAWVPLIWDRYFLPLAPFIAVITAYGFLVIIKFFRHLIQRQALSKEQKRILYFDAIGVACSVIMTFIIWNNIMDRSVIPAYLCPDRYGKHEYNLSLYEKAGLTHAPDPWRMIYTADLKLLSNDLAGACLLYEKAAGIFQSRPPSTINNSMTAIAQYNLARAYYKSSRFKEAAMMLEAHIGNLRKIACSLKTKDPGVTAEINRIIEERINYLENIPKN